MIHINTKKDDLCENTSKLLKQYYARQFLNMRVTLEHEYGTVACSYSKLLLGRKEVEE